MKKKNYLFLIIVLAIGSALFSYFYANYHGVCVIEGRKLSHDELLQRGMISYFRWLKNAEYSADEEDRIWRKYCYSDEYPNKNHRCYIRLLSSQTAEDYIKYRSTEKGELDFKNFKLAHKKEEQDFYFEPFEVFLKQMKNNQNNPFSFYVFLKDYNDYRGDYFYPKDCCEINDLSYFFNHGFSQESAPPFNWRIFGWGNYFLSKRHLMLTNETAYYSQKTLALNNCGKITHKKPLKNENFHTITSPQLYFLTNKNIDDRTNECLIFQAKHFFKKKYSLMQFLSLYQGELYWCHFLNNRSNL